jgi:hypothetical protein
MAMMDNYRIHAEKGAESVIKLCAIRSETPDFVSYIVRFSRLLVIFRQFWERALIWPLVGAKSMRGRRWREESWPTGNTGRILSSAWQDRMSYVLTTSVEGGTG